MSYKINCSNPVRIVNPLIKQQILTCDKYTCQGKIYSLTDKQKYAIFNGVSPYKVLCSPIAASDIVDWSLIDSLGVLTPIEILVPCGKCDICRKKYVNSLVQRSTFEEQQSNDKCVFITLTYNNNYIPWDHSVRKDHVQKFKKRFNKLSSKLFKGDFSNKWICVSEYGKLRRPHYHIILFTSIPHSTYRDIFLLTQMVQYCWRANPDKVCFHSYCLAGHKVFNRITETDEYSFGFVNVQVSRFCASYVTKYVSKPSNNLPDRNQNFVLVSRNLGCDFVKSNLNTIFENQGKFVYFDKFQSKLVSTFLCGYYVNKFFPSVSAFVPSELRACWFDFCHSYSILRNIVTSKYLTKEISTIYYQMVQKYSFLEVSEVNFLDFNFQRTFSERDYYFSEFYRNYLYLFYFPKDKYELILNNLDNIIKNHNLFYSLKDNSPDISINSFVASRDNNLLISKQKLL